jgi:hypothetical protein
MGTDMGTPLTIWLDAMRRQWRMVLFIVGPAAGVMLVALIFGLPPDLWLIAAGMTIFAALLALILLRAEIRFLRSRAG